MPSRPNSNPKPGHADKAQTNEHQAGRGSSVESNPRKSEDEGQNRHGSQG